MSFQRPSTMRHAFEEKCKVVFPKHQRQGFDKMVDNIVSSLIRKVGMVREHDNFNLKKSTFNSLKNSGII